MWSHFYCLFIYFFKEKHSREWIPNEFQQILHHKHAVLLFWTPRSMCRFKNHLHLYISSGVIFLIYTLFSEINVQRLWERWWNYKSSYRWENRAACLGLGIQISFTQRQINVQLNWKDISSSPFRPTMDNHSEAE